MGGITKIPLSGFSGIAAIRNPNKNIRLCVCIIIHEFVALSAAYCIFKSKKLPKNGRLFIRTGKGACDVEYMVYPDEYKVLGQKEFDIGVIGVSNLTNFEKCRHRT